MADESRLEIPERSGSTPTGPEGMHASKHIQRGVTQLGSCNGKDVVKPDVSTCERKEGEKKPLKLAFLSRKKSSEIVEIVCST